MLTKLKKFSKGLKHYIFNLIIIWSVILFYRINNYYVNFLRTDTQATLFYLALTYTIFGFLYYILVPIEKISASKGLILFRAFKRIYKEINLYIKNFNSTTHKLPKLERHEKTTILFLIVKIFYLPLMLNFFFANYDNLKYLFQNLPAISTLFSISSFNIILFPLLISLIFAIDTLYFAFGYSVEAKFLKNKIRSVEPTILGWIVALISYPPFNIFATSYIVWYANDHINFATPTITFLARISITTLLLIYLSATIALGTKCSNLTNRGIVSRGPYRFVRHPAYISKNLAWWITLIPIMSLTVFLSMSAWSSIYYLRAITEERHLIKDPDYQEYYRKVRYKFVPGVW